MRRERRNPGVSGSLGRERKFRAGPPFTQWMRGRSMVSPRIPKGRGILPPLGFPFVSCPNLIIFFRHPLKGKKLERRKGLREAAFVGFALFFKSPEWMIVFRVLLLMLFNGLVVNFPGGQDVKIKLCTSRSASPSCGRSSSCSWRTIMGVSR